MTGLHLEMEGSGHLFDTLTLKGFVRRYFEGRGRPPGDAGSAIPPHHVQETYKLYADERAILSRLGRLPSPLQEVVGKAIAEFGGILPRAMFERLDFPACRWDSDTWRRQLESHFLGTVCDLSLSPYGIHASEETLVLFQEAVLGKLRALCDERPASVVTEVVMGVDLASDLARFLAFLREDQVRFTVQGGLFKTSEKRLVEQFVPGVDPSSKEPAAHEVLDFIYRFAVGERLVHRTGERTYSVSDRGLHWESQPLLEKQQELLRFSVEDRHLPGEPFHQVRMRRFCLRYLRRLEPERWYDAMFLPFVARNAYMATLDGASVEQFFAVRGAHQGTSMPFEDIQQMGWNLLVWVRRRLALLGIVDLGLDSVGRPVAIRLSRLGAQLLGIVPAQGIQAGHSHLVVNPNFDVVLLPEGDEFELAHALDRFCVRRKHEVLYHYQLTEESLRRGLRDGLRVPEILHWLSRYTRAPLPQNVVFSIHEWAERAGVVWLEGSSLRTRDLACLERLLSIPRVAQHVAARPAPDLALLRPGLPLAELRTLAKEAGLWIERP